MVDKQESMTYQKHEGTKLDMRKVNCCSYRLHDCTKRFKKSKTERLFDKGRELLDKEIDIVSFLQS